MDSNNKLTVKQQRQLQERERNKAKRKLGGNINGEELEEAVINSRIQKSIDQILQFFPKRFPPPPTPSSSASFLKAKPSNLPFTTLKRHVSWLDTITQSASSPLSLGEEIFKFAQYISLKDEETACRHEIVKEIGEIVQTKWPPPVKVQTFGSFYSGLSIFLSDVDITILGLGLEKETHDMIYNSSGGGYNNGDNALTTTTTAATPRIDPHAFFKAAVETELRKSMGSSSSSSSSQTADILYNIDDTDESDIEYAVATGGQEHINGYINQKQDVAAVIYDEDGDVIMDDDDYYEQQEEGFNNGSDDSNNDRSVDDIDDGNSENNESENSSNIDNIEWHLDTTGENNITTINSSSSIGNCTNTECLQDVVVRDDNGLVDHIDNARLDDQHQTLIINDDYDGSDDDNDGDDLVDTEDDADVVEYNNNDNDDGDDAVDGDQYNNDDVDEYYDTTHQTKKFKSSSSSSYQNDSHQHKQPLAAEAVSQQTINGYNAYMNKLAADRAYEMLIIYSFVGGHPNKSNTSSNNNSNINDKKSTSSSIVDTSISTTAATAIMSSSSSNTTAEVILNPLQQQALPIFAKPVIRFMPPPTATIDATKLLSSSSSVQTVPFKHQSLLSSSSSSSAMLSSSSSSSLSQSQQTHSQSQRMNDLNDNSDDEDNDDNEDGSDGYDDVYETCSDGDDDNIHDNHFDPEFLNSITTSSLIHINTNDNSNNNSNITPRRLSKSSSSSNSSSSGFNSKGRTDRPYLSKRDEDQIKLEQVQKLGVIYKHLQGMDYVKEMELRRRAKVPIISMIHGNQIGVDISCGVLSKDTTDLVVKLLTHSGGSALFVPISCVLKIFLHQFGLDEPYLGGIGSFKLYVMIAYIVDIIGCGDSYDNSCGSNCSNKSSSSSVVINYDYDHIAKILLAFFKHFGIRKHLNTDTVLSVYNTEVTFETCRLIESCQQAFHKAYTILAMAMEKYNEAKTNHHDTRYHNKTNSKTNHQVSNSILSLIIYAEELQKEREESLRSCRLYAPQTDTEKNKIAENILNQLYNKVVNQQKSTGNGNNSVNSSSSPKLLTKLTVENIATVNPLLLLKLKSYRNVEKFFKPFQTTNRSNNNNNGSSGSRSSRVNMTNISRNSKNVLKRSSDSNNSYVKSTTQLSSSRRISSKKSRVSNDTITVSSSSTLFNNTAAHSANSTATSSPIKQQPAVPVATFSRGGVIGSAFQTLHTYQQSQQQSQSQQQPQMYTNTSISNNSSSSGTSGKRKWNEYKRSPQTDNENSNSSNTNNVKSSSSSSYAKTDIRHGGDSQKNLSHLKESIIKSKLLLLANKKRFTKGSGGNNTK